jgi:cytochrome c biogenesis protein CcmG, thiol:disulfide interchange protein DsbE
MLVSIGAGTTLAIVLIVIVSIVTGGSAQPGNPLDGHHLAKFRLTGLSGGHVESPWATGHPAVVVFFASWCAPCKAELPMVASWVSSHDLAPVDVIGVDVNDENPAGEAFARTSKVTFPVGVDPVSTLANSEFSLPGLPDTVFVGANGDVVSAINGPVSLRELATGVEQLQ